MRSVEYNVILNLFQDLLPRDQMLNRVQHDVVLTTSEQLYVKVK